MILSYIFIEKYGKVENFNLNFHSKFKYDFNPKIGILKLDNQRDYTSEFYSEFNANIKAISAIVGQNGVGKSTIIRFIKNNFIESAGGVHAPCIVGVYDEKDDLHYIYYYKISINNVETELKNEVEEIIMGSTELQGFEIYNKINAFDDITVINYSGLLDLSPEENQYQGSYNISTNRLAYTATDSYTGEDRSINLNEIEIFRIQEVERQIRFYSKFRGVLPFQRPDYIFMRINVNNQRKVLSFINEEYKRTVEEKNSYENNSEAVNELKNRNNKIEKFNHLFSLLEKFQKEIAVEQYPNLQSDLFLQLFFSFLKGELQYYRNSLNLIYYLENYYKKAEDSKLNSSSEKLQYFFEINETRDSSTQFDDSRSIIDFRNIIHHLEKIVKIQSGQEYFGNQIFFNLDTEDKEDVLLDLFKTHTNACNTSFLDFYWPLSSGEQSLFSLYSRFYDIIIKNHQFKNLQIKNNILILLDEAEISLHPQWQRSFLKDFLSVITEIFKGKNIQLILTTHSPFVLSDLVLSQINFIEMDERTTRGKLVKNPLSEKKSTFGANINTLLSDSFFMKDGFAGALVLDRMDEFIDLILTSDINVLRERYDYIDWFVHQIGEPIIRNKIMQMIESRLSTDLINTSKRLDEFNERLKKLE